MAGRPSPLQPCLIMTTSRLCDEGGAIRRLSLRTRQAWRVCACRRGLDEAAGPRKTEFDRRTQRTVIAPVTFTAGKAFSDSAPVADEHFLLNPWHDHAVSGAPFMRSALREVPALSMTNHLKDRLSMVFGVDDRLRHSSSVEAAVF
jgi:hypothetical protein